MILSIQLVPSASRDEIVGWHDGALKVRIAAPPVEGKANEALLRFLAKELDVPMSELRIEGGLSSKRKRVSIPMTDEDLKTALKL